MPSELAGFVRRMENLAAVYQRSPAELVTASARVYTAAIRSSIQAAAPGSKLRGVGKYNGGARKGANVGVKYTVNGNVATVQATGPLHLLERDTKDHDIPRTAGSRRTRTAAGRLSRKRETTGRSLSAARPLFVDGHWVTGPIHHPGTKGKHPFERGVVASEQTAALAAVTQLRKEISGIFKAAT